MQLLNNFNCQEFLQQYWQQKPVVIRNALPEFDNPITPDELAGLACEPQVESRLIVEKNNHWHLQHGPLDEQTFSELPDSHWTLLVQAVDHWVPEVAQLLNHFRFIPNWRIDDVMVSYACEGGSVGPHYDNYDVFLVQGYGQRRWQLGPKYSSQSELQDNDQLRLLTNFEAEQEWLLEPGDILYVPPLFGHWGTAASADCMTYSVGFRAPSHAEILSDFCDYQISQLSDEQRYSDANLPLQQNPGEISSEALSQVREIIRAQLENDSNIAQWFGQFMTAPKDDQYAPDELITVSSSTLKRQLEQDDTVYRNASFRFAFTNSEDTAILFVNGASLSSSASALPLVILIANQDQYSGRLLAPYLADEENRRLLLQLFDRGCLYFEHELYD